MKKALITVDPVSEKGAGFQRYCEIIRAFQEKGLLTEASLASVIHGSLYAVPTSWYRTHEKSYLNAALVATKESCSGRISFQGVKALAAKESSAEAIVKHASQYASRAGADLMVMASHERKGLPLWFLGSFSQTAAITASLPVMVVKPQLKLTELSREISFTVGVDLAAPPSSKAIRWIAEAAKVSDAHLDLVYVMPRQRLLVDSVQQRRNKSEAEKTLRALKKSFAAQGVKQVSFTVLKEDISVAHTLADFADRRKAWALMMTAPKRSAFRRLMLGSVARNTLALTKRPFISLRCE